MKTITFRTDEGVTQMLDSQVHDEIVPTLQAICAHEPRGYCISEK